MAFDGVNGEGSGQGYDVKEAKEDRALLMVLWERGEDFPWHVYCPSFAEFRRELREWADARP